MPKKKKEIKRIERDGKFYTVRGVELCRCSGTKTEKAFISFILSGLRRLTKYWKPKIDVLLEARRPYCGPVRRIKWEYQCALCYTWCCSKDIELDHIIPIGGLTSIDEIPRWVRKAFVEKEGYQVLCKECHHKKTQKEKQLTNKEPKNVNPRGKRQQKERAQ